MSPKYSGVESQRIQILSPFQNHCWSEDSAKKPEPRNRIHVRNALNVDFNIHVMSPHYSRETLASKILEKRLHRVTQSSYSTIFRDISDLWNPMRNVLEQINKIPDVNCWQFHFLKSRNSYVLGRKCCTTSFPHLAFYFWQPGRVNKYFQNTGLAFRRPPSAEDNECPLQLKQEFKKDSLQILPTSTPQLVSRESLGRRWNLGTTSLSMGKAKEERFREPFEFSVEKLRMTIQSILCCFSFHKAKTKVK